jgi:hypothetical protein
MKLNARQRPICHVSAICVGLRLQALMHACSESDCKIEREHSPPDELSDAEHGVLAGETERALKLVRQPPVAKVFECPCVVQDVCVCV